MRTIEYRGHTPVVDVPIHQLAGVRAGVPFEVADDVAADLTLGGASEVWVDVTPQQSKPKEG